jgi:hypothetical protein
MCRRCALDLRRMPLVEVEALLHEPSACERLRRAAEREYDERLRGLDLCDPADEKL